MAGYFLDSLGRSLEVHRLDKGLLEACPMPDPVLGAGCEAWSNRHELVAEQVPASLSKEGKRSRPWKDVPARELVH